MRLPLITLCALLLMSCGQQKKETERVVTVEVPGVPPPGEPVKPTPEPVVPKKDFVSFAAFESENLADATEITSDKQINARFFTLCDMLNAGTLNDAMRLGIQKAINSVTREVTLESGVWLGENKCTLRVDCRDFGICGEKWRFLEERDPLKFESFTDRGLLLKQLTQSKRPWIHAANFMEFALRNETYYRLLDIPVRLEDFVGTYLGCSLQKDFDEFNQDLFLAGVRRSRIALQKNRMVLFTQCRDGALSSTYDTILEQVTSSARNLSINPFPIEAKTNNTFGHDAQEYIFTLPNKLQAYALFDAKGVRQNFAPTNTVTDTGKADINPEIENGRSCFSCHSTGYLEVNDFIAEHVKGNPQFSIEEIQKATAYFGRNEAMHAAMRQSNKDYEGSLKKLGISIDLEDPVNQVTDQIRREMVVKQIAGMLFLKEEDFKKLLVQSPAGTLAIGQLLNGGAVNFQDFVQVAQVLVKDLNLFKEDLGQ